MMIESISILSIGLLLLLVGSNILVTSTDNTARRFSISGFYVSFFMIGIATSAPEIFVSIESALRNKTVLAIGNAFGSNISNIALVFCLSLFFVRGKLNKNNLPVRPFISMTALSLIAFLLMYFDENLDIKDSFILIILFIISLYYLKSPDEIKSTDTNNYSSLMLLLTYFVLSLGMLIYGSFYFIRGATQIATFLGISPYTIGLTLTALGTSLPELAASIQSARKGKIDFIVGNIIGSNIFNIAIAMSLAGIISSSDIDANDLMRDVLMLSFCTLALYIIIRSNSMFRTVYSLILVITYFLYLILIFK
jgi:cation:H+ antiporter|tara:strand:- start:170 stop:1096 length:927 start_codon:yes stop_codon:yes gene_type:complete